MPTTHSYRPTWFQSAFFVGLLLAVFTCPSLGLSDDQIEPLNEYSGKVEKTILLFKQPKNGFIFDQKNWKSLWNAWRPNTAVPQVDFQTHMVLVETANGPNNVLTSAMLLNAQGNLRYDLSKSKKPGDGFGYLLVVIPTKNIVSVNGRKIDATPKVRPSPPPVPVVTQPETAAPIVTAPIASVPEPKGSIKVEIDGQIRTGITTSRDSTNAMIMSKGIVWELDFQNKPSLFQTAKRLGSNFAIVKGELIRIKQPNLLYSYRWIVLVDSIYPSDTKVDLPEPNPGNSPPQASPRIAANDQPAVAQASLGPAKTGSAPDADSLPPLTTIPTPPETRQLAPDRGQAPTAQIARKTFRSISIKLTRGKRGDEQIQKVAPDGSALIEVPSTGYADRFKISQDDLVKLHQFVGKTDWRNVPRSTRSPKATQNSPRMEITVETYDGSMRFEVDGEAIGSTPFGQMFKFMGKPKK